MAKLFVKKAKKTAAYARGVAQAVDFTGAIGSRRLYKIRSQTAEEALARDWAKIGGDFRYVTTRWMRKHDG